MKHDIYGFSTLHTTINPGLSSSKCSLCFWFEKFTAGQNGNSLTQTFIIFQTPTPSTSVPVHRPIWTPLPTSLASSSQKLRLARYLIQNKLSTPPLALPSRRRPPAPLHLAAAVIPYCFPIPYVPSFRATPCRAPSSAAPPLPTPVMPHPGPRISPAHRRHHPLRRTPSPTVPSSHVVPYRAPSSSTPRPGGQERCRHRPGVGRAQVKLAAARSASLGAGCLEPTVPHSALHRPEEGVKKPILQ